MMFVVSYNCVLGDLFNTFLIVNRVAQLFEIYSVSFTRPCPNYTGNLVDGIEVFSVVLGQNNSFNNGSQHHRTFLKDSFIHWGHSIYRTLF